MLEIIAQTSMYQEILGRGLKEGIEQGREQEVRKLVSRLLNKRFAVFDQEVQDEIDALSVEQLEELNESILDFQSLDDLHFWLVKQKNKHGNQSNRV